MQVPKLKILIEAGAVRSISVMYDAIAGGWIVLPTFKTADAGEKSEALERQRGGVRTFATLDAAARFLLSLGVREFQVIARDWQQASR